MSGQRVGQPDPLVLNAGPLNGFNDEQVENDDAIQDTTPIARLGVNDTQSQSSIKVSWLATQISEFSGEQVENVSQWMRRVDKVTQIHDATDDVTLLATSSRLTKSAKK